MDDDIESLALELNKLASRAGQLKRKKKLSSQVESSKAPKEVKSSIEAKEDSIPPKVLEDKFRCGKCGNTFSEKFRRCPHCGIEFE